MAQREANNILQVNRLSMCYPEEFLDKRSSSSYINMVLDHYAASHGVDHLFVKGAFRVILQNLRLNELELSKLTTLHLEYCWWPYGVHSDTECFDFSAVCPNLVLSSCFVWRFKVLKISGAKLVNLTMNGVGCDHKVEISAPKLMVLKIKGETELNFSAINLPSLKHAEVGCVLCDGRWKQNDVQILKDLWGMKWLFAENMLKFFRGLQNAVSYTMHFFCSGFSYGYGYDRGSTFSLQQIEVLEVYRQIYKFPTYDFARDPPSSSSNKSMAPGGAVDRLSDLSDHFIQMLKNVKLIDRGLKIPAKVITFDLNMPIQPELTHSQDSCIAEFDNAVVMEQGLIKVMIMGHKIPAAGIDVDSNNRRVGTNLGMSKEWLEEFENLAYLRVGLGEPKDIVDGIPRI
ncbi:unnamed protein product [Dovyalis caffra]|uniref:Uncharacterized protein n=1 Tax=Dovyalis caffra TaxID=77055 RepID=A0AAV1QPV3_9ROSI|nr:unnamed protein product [Dovyalis caffra]